MSAEASLTRHNPSLSRLTKATCEMLSQRALSEDNFTHPLPAGVSHFVEQSLSSATQAAYAADLRHFSDWGGRVPCSAEIAASYLAEHAELLSVATLVRRLAAISKAHEVEGAPNPTKAELVRATMRGIKRSFGAPQKEAAPLLREELFQLLDAMGEQAKDVRDRAVLLIGFAGGFRRSELVALNFEDVEVVRQGLKITIRRSKSDQAGAGRKLAVPLGRSRHCAVAALQHWLDRSEIDTGPIFRRVDRHGNIRPQRLSGEAVSRIVQERAASSGLCKHDYSGHSLRAGFATSAAQAGVPSYKIRAQTGHKSDAMLSRYIRDAEMFLGNAVAALL